MKPTFIMSFSCKLTINMFTMFERSSRLLSMSTSMIRLPHRPSVININVSMAPKAVICLLGIIGVNGDELLIRGDDDDDTLGEYM